MENKKKFIYYEILASTLLAGFMHAKIYNTQTNLDKDELENAKVKMRWDIKQRLVDIGKNYTVHEVNDDQHIKNINELVDCITTRHEPILFEGKFRFGIAQKLLNLYLKYLWALGWIDPVPPHCPVDSTVSKALRHEYKFIKSDDVVAYKKIIEEAKQVATKNGTKIAEWEMNEFLETNYSKLNF